MTTKSIEHLKCSGSPKLLNEDVSKVQQSFPQTSICAVVCQINLSKCSVFREFAYGTLHVANAAINCSS